MDETLILAELEAQVRTMPPFMSNSAFRRPNAVMPDDYHWIGRTVALLEHWDKYKVMPVRIAAQSLYPSPMFQAHVGTIQVTIYEAIADLKLRVQQRPGGAFAANAVYDYFRLLKDTIGLAISDVFIVDPYLSDDIFTYLSVAGPGATIRLMMKPKQQLTSQVQAGRQHFQQQYNRQVEVRQTNDIHDRLVFVNKQTCYLSGASIKDAAKKAPTYLAPLSADLVQDKLAVYEAIWASATAI